MSTNDQATVAEKKFTAVIAVDNSRAAEDAFRCKAQQLIIVLLRLELGIGQGLGLGLG